MYPYWEWECYINKMYDEIIDEAMINNSYMLLSDMHAFSLACKDVLYNWKISTIQHLTNKQINKKAWLGQACCSYKYKSTEMSTRIAWSRLTNLQQIKANNIALNHINNYEKTNRRIFKEMGNARVQKSNTRRSATSLACSAQSTIIQGCLFGYTKE